MAAKLATKLGEGGGKKSRNGRHADAPPRELTPADIEASKADLPAGTAYVVVPGASHASFGVYGRQPHDGTPTADAAAVQEQVSKAAVDLLASITPQPK